MDSHMKDLKKRKEQRQKELKNLSGDRNNAYSRKYLWDDPQKEPYADLMVAIMKGVDRRFQATSWIWGREGLSQKSAKNEWYTVWRSTQYT